MNVSQLINKLSKLDKDANVIFYLEEAEDGGSPSEVKIVSKGDELPYFKCGEVDEDLFFGDKDQSVVIHCEPDIFQ